MKKLYLILIILLFCVGLTGTVFALDTRPEAESNAPHPEKLYGIGSVSKVFTAAAVMLLADEDKIGLDTPIITYIPEFTMADERYRKITPRMLLNHSSGLMGMTDNNVFLTADNDTYNHDNFLQFLSTQTLKHEPGERSIYSNDSSTLAEVLVEFVSGMTFTDFIEQKFSKPLNLSNIKTPQSDFDRTILAPTYLGNSELKPQNLNVIGSGGIYSTMKDLCFYATIFMNNVDGSILSKESVNEMAKNQHLMEVVAPGSDTIFRYGLGWDSVDMYPFNQLGIKALSKGGSTGIYFTNLTVLPEYNLAAAVASSGAGGLEALISQQIILAVLEEEGLIPPGTVIGFPPQNLTRAEVPENLKTRSGLYDSGIGGFYDVTFTENSLILTPVGVRNERPMEFIYNTDDKFVSVNGDFIGMHAIAPGAVGFTNLRFIGDYLTVETYIDVPGLGQVAETMPFAERIIANPVSGTAQNGWAARNDNEYLLVSEKYTSSQYIDAALAKTKTDERFPGYVTQGIYRGSGRLFPAARIMDKEKAYGYQNIPTIMGRDIVNLSMVNQNGNEYLKINNYCYVNASTAILLSTLEEVFTINDEPIWVNVDESWGGKIISIQTPENGSWFVYDDKMNCLATSLEKNVRRTVILPEGGRIAFAGETGAEFVVK
ncbi:MAG: beta-lactamase family protein [Lachnospiraceae bacterium]|nr:beta-lactamase family protein [Lachnospiraceae bacterium]